MPCIHDEEMVEALRSDRPHEPLGIGVCVRGPERGLEDLGTSDRKTSSKVATYFVSRSRTRNLTSIPSSAISLTTFLACCSNLRREQVSPDEESMDCQWLPNEKGLQDPQMESTDRIRTQDRSDPRIE